MNFFKIVLASALGYIIAAVVVFGLIAAMIVGIASSAKKEVSIKTESVLNLKLDYTIKDRMQENNPFAAFEALDPNLTSPAGLNDILASIEQAKTDDKIKGIILDLSTLDAGYGKIMEIRTKLDEFKESGKFIYAYADYYQYKTYYLASVADSIFMNPEGQMLLNGMTAQVTFLSNTLKKLGIEVDVIRHGKYKSAGEAFVRQSLSEENRKQLSEYVNSVYDNTLAQIASSRGQEVEQLKAHANSLDMTSVSEYAAAGYIEGTQYRDEFYSMMKGRMGLDDEDKVELVTVKKYSKLLDKNYEASDRIAIVYALGDIVTGKGDGTQIAADDLVQTLKKVRETEKIKAVVLRINSRGGSALASEIIWREVQLLADAKPLVVSMSDYAASGGYYIAAPAHTIVADPTTITGSIGVFGLVPNAKKLFNDKLGMNFEYVGTGEYSDFGRIDQALEAEERAYIQEIIDQIYNTFVKRVSDGRDLSPDQVDSIAQGRVWTGSMAKEIGLVDELGGLEYAVELAAKAADLEEYKIREYPKLKDPFNQIFERMQGNASLEQSLLRTSYGHYIKTLMDAEKLASQHSVQAMLPFAVDLKHYSLR
ncbi:MAG: signal peptide peptidase SppA [Bacteroidia bacterium]